MWEHIRLISGIKLDRLIHLFVSSDIKVLPAETFLDPSNVLTLPFLDGAPPLFPENVLPLSTILSLSSQKPERTKGKTALN